MEIINIDEFQKIRLCDELSRLVLKFKEDPTVECIYCAPYKGLGEVKGNVLEFTIVKENKVDNKTSDYIFKYNDKSTRDVVLRSYGVKIFIDLDDADKYVLVDINPSEVNRTNNLFNSIILFDRTGKYTDIKKQAEKNYTNVVPGLFYYDNLAEIYPDITDSLHQLMKEKAKKKI